MAVKTNGRENFSRDEVESFQKMVLIKLSTRSF